MLRVVTFFIAQGGQEIHFLDCRALHRELGIRMKLLTLQ